MKHKEMTGVGRWWILQQHREFTVVQSENPPSTARVGYERGKRAIGPFPDQASADARVDIERARTLPGLWKAMATK